MLIGLVAENTENWEREGSEELRGVSVARRYAEMVISNLSFRPKQRRQELRSGEISYEMKRELSEISPPKCFGQATPCFVPQHSGRNDKRVG
ncbi:MAG: hypothetical protein EA392_00880 [Cryomorphaceae bacterium]|nr:MAG: hypothetical protein EA392_00880 [Cryomorphaceae bacterium]